METNGYRLLLPEGTLDYFNISDVKESSSEIVIYLEEKNELPGEYSTVKVESKGFYDPVVVRDFPIRGKNLFLNIRRRRWILYGVFGAAAALTRMTGLLVILPAAVELLAGERPLAPAAERSNTYTL